MQDHEPRTAPPRKFSRRVAIETGLVVGGVGLIFLSGSEYVLQSRPVALQVDNQLPPLGDRVLQKLKERADILKGQGQISEKEKKDLGLIEGVIAIVAPYQQERSDRYSKVMAESDQTQILGIVQKGSLRLWVAGIGLALTAAGIASKAGSTIYRRLTRLKPQTAFK